MGKRKEFNLRWQEEKQTIKVKEIEFRFVTVHPFGDEHKMLKKLNRRPNECTYVGSYIEFGFVIYFVEFVVEREMPAFFIEGVYFCLNRDYIYSKSIVKGKYLKTTDLRNWIEFMLNRNLIELKQKLIIRKLDIEINYRLIK